MTHWQQQQLDSLAQQGLYRQMMALQSASGPVGTIDGQEKIIFCSNNYLGLANHPHVIEAIKSSLDDWGYGSGASRLICGNMSPHEALQNRLAKKLTKESCLVFPTGFMTNYAILTSLAEKEDLIVVDKLVHASIIDGARASEAQLRTFPHKQTDKLIRLLEQGEYRRAFIVTDSLFSMDGDKADLKELVDIKKRFDATLIVDEAHAFGCLGEYGLGVTEEQSVLDDIDVYVGTFSKAIGGSGGFVAGDKSMTEILINKARSFIYTTGIPAINCIAANAAIEVIEKEPQRRKILNHHAQQLRDHCTNLGLDIAGSKSYIVPVIIGDPKQTVDISVKLWEEGIMIPAIRPPTVAPGSSRLRISLSSDHTESQIDQLCQSIKNILQYN